MGSEMYIQKQMLLHMEVEKILIATLHSLLYIMIAESPKEVTKDFFVISTGKVYFLL